MFAISNYFELPFSATSHALGHAERSELPLYPIPWWQTPVERGRDENSKGLTGAGVRNAAACPKEGSEGCLPRHPILFFSSRRGRTSGLSVSNLPEE